MSSAVVLVEGSCGAGKTTLIAVAAERARSAGVTVRVFGQRETYAPIAPSEDAHILDDELNFAILSRIVSSIEKARTGLALPSLVLIDTLHITQFVRPGFLSVDSFDRVEERLAALGSSVVFLRAERETLRERAVEGRRGTGFRRYIEQFAQGEDELTEYFVDSQRRMMQLLERCKRPALVLSAEESPDRLAERVLAAV